MSGVDTEIVNRIQQVCIVESGSIGTLHQKEIVKTAEVSHLNHNETVSVRVFVPAKQESVLSRGVLKNAYNEWYSEMLFAHCTAKVFGACNEMLQCKDDVKNDEIKSFDFEEKY